MTYVAAQAYRYTSSGLLKATGGRVLQPAGYNPVIPVPPSPFNRFTPVASNALQIGSSLSVGVQPGIALTSSGSILSTATGQLIENIDVHGYINITSAGVTIRNCRVRGIPASQAMLPNSQGGFATSGGGLIMGNGFNLQGALIEFCTLDATGNESIYTDGISGSNFTARYNEITRTNDGVHISTSYGATVECNWIHSGYLLGFADHTHGSYNPHNPMAGFPPGQQLAGYPSSPSDRRNHGDGIQVANGGGSGVNIRSNRIGGPPGYTGPPADLQYLDPNVTTRDPSLGGKLAPSEILAAANSGESYTNTCIFGAAASTGITGDWSENWLTGGSAVINMALNPPNNSDSFSGVTLRNNVSTKPTWPNAGYGIYLGSGASPVRSNNTYTDGSPMTVNTY